MPQNTSLQMAQIDLCAHRFTIAQLGHTVQARMSCFVGVCKCSGEMLLERDRGMRREAGYLVYPVQIEGTREGD